MLERLLGFSLKHRYFMVLSLALAAAFGFFSLQKLPIDAVPDITNKQVQINTELAGLAPEDMEKQVTLAIENALAGVPGLESTRSLTRNGFSQVTAIFHDEVDIYFARNQITERLNEIQASLPDGAAPHMGAIATGLGEVYMWSLRFAHPGGQGAGIKAGEPGWQGDGCYRTPEGEVLCSESEQLAYLRTVQDWIIRPQIKNLPGVAGVDAIGGYEKQYQVEPDPLKLRAYGLGINDVTQALQQANQSRGAGFIEHNGEAYLVRVDGRLRSVDDIAATVLDSRNGTPVRVRDVAQVRMGQALRSGSATENGQEVVVGTALMRIGENSRTVALAVDRKMTEVRRSLPPDVEVQTVLNRSKLVQATIVTVLKNLSEGALLVVVVLFVLLGNLRAALITAAVIPVTVLLMSSGMLKAGISGNLMSLGALDFGLIVDGAVIIVENCLSRLAQRQQHLGRSLTLDERLAEVLHASREMVQPSVFGQAIIMTVYLPLLALEGVEGKMFQPMALTVIMALLAAFVLSLTLVPALVAIFFTGPVNAHDSRLLQKSRQVYAPLLQKALRRQGLVIASALFLFALGLLLFGRLGQEFIPSLDEKDVAMHAMRIPSTGISQSTAMQQRLEKAISQLPEVAYIFSKTGTAEMAADPMPPSVSDTFIIFKAREQWPDPGLEKTGLIRKIRQQAETVPGNNYEFTQPIQMRFNELLSGVRSDVAVKVFGDDFASLQKTARQLAVILRAIPGASEVKVEPVSGQALLDVAFDREALARYGLSMASVQAAVAAAMAGEEAGEIFSGDQRYAIVLRLPENLRADLEQLRTLPLSLPGGQGFVTLGMVAHLDIRDGLNQISRENGKRRIVVQANVRGRDLGSFVAEAQTTLAHKLDLPAGYWLSFGGQYENLHKAKQQLQVLVPACFALIFLLLFSALGSARQAAMVFSAVPLGLSGGMLALWLRDMPFSITAAVGFIALSGVAVLNGLVLVSRFNQLRAHGRSLEQAVFEGALSRLRPVLMTALVAALGFLPMALASGTGAEVQKPLATVVIGGLLSSTLLTLLVLPVLYRRFERAD